jgi:hypothetical protein
MSTVSRRARRHEDRAGDPLDGLVNMFDLGIVLALGFLLAALASLKLSGVIANHGLTQPASNLVTIAPSETMQTVPPDAQRTAGHGTPVGQVYRLDDGRLIYVVPNSVVPTPTSQPSAESTP